MSEEKTKLGFTVLRIVDIPVEYLRKGVERALRGRESFDDVDTDLDEKIYSGNVFENIACENAELDDDSHFKLFDEDLAQIEELAADLEEYELVRVTRI